MRWCNRLSLSAESVARPNAALASRFKAASAFHGGGIGPVEDLFGRKTLRGVVQ
jgi:hypothetical protein